MMENTTLVLAASFFAIAMIYASVGFGGGSSYLALMALMEINFLIMKPAALLCNIIVVAGGTYIFYKEGHLDLKKYWPLFAASIPLAFLGGYYELQEDTFFIILGLSLIVSSFFLWFQPRPVSLIRSSNTAVMFGLGGSIGFLSGLVSIGGGIFLSPLLHLLNWDAARRISAIASFFILVNSISGLLGQITQSATFDFAFTLPLLGAVLLGGQIGSRLGAQRFSPLYIKRITAVLILVAGINILKDHL
jgi:uncharacterized membrane protein YfcA